MMAPLSDLILIAKTGRKTLYPYMLFLLCPLWTQSKSSITFRSFKTTAACLGLGPIKIFCIHFTLS